MVTKPIDPNDVERLQLEYCGLERLPDVMRIMESSFSSEFGESWNNNQCRSMLSLHGTRLTVAFVDGRAIGFLISRAVAREEELLMVAVDPEYQKNGAGTALLQHMLAEARKNSVEAVFLEVRSNNPAQKLYGTLGFEKIGVRTAYYTGADKNKFDANTYKLTLS